MSNDLPINGPGRSPEPVPQSFPQPLARVRGDGALPPAARFERGQQGREFSVVSERATGSAAYAAVARLAPSGQAVPTRLLADPTKPAGAQVAARPAEAKGQAFSDPDQAKAVAQENFASLSSAVIEVNRAMAALSGASVQRYMNAGGEFAIRAMAGALRDANTQVEIAVRRLRDAFQVSGTVTVRRKDGTVEMGSFSLAFTAGGETGSLHSPAAAGDSSVPDDSEELTGDSGYRPGSGLDMRV